MPVRQTVFDALRQDVKYGMRQLGAKPGFAVTAILSLALGIGANTAFFTLFDQVLLRLLPVRNPRELVQLRVEGGRFGSNNGDGLHTFSYPSYLALRDQNTVLAGLTGQRIEQASLVGEDRSEMITVGMVAGNYFTVLGVQPYTGRLITPEDDRQRNGHPVAVLQYAFWQSRFAGSPETVGSTIRLNGTPFNVIGIAAPKFEGTDVGLPNHVWVPIMMKSAITPTWDGLDDERYAWFYLFGRLKSGVSLDEAQASMKVLYRQRQQQELNSPFFRKFPDLQNRFLRQNFVLIPASRGQSILRFRFERPLIVLQWLVGVVLLIACTNVANLLLARAAARQREMAIRGALGASRGQLVRQLFVESLILAAGGGVAGLVLSTWLSRGLIRFLPFDPENMSLSTTPDARVLLFTTGVTFVAALVFGLIPALQGSRVPAGETLKEEAGSVAGSRTHVRLRKLFVSVQVGLSLLLVVSAGLFARTLQNLQNVDLGFRIENVVMFGVRPATVYDGARKQQVFRSLVESLATVPGVKAVGANTSRLLTGGRWDSSITVAGLAAKDSEYPWSFFNAVTPGYFAALGIPIKSGRDFSWNDWDSARKLCLVNERLVGDYFRGANPLGRLMAQGREQTPDTEIIGVFGNAKYHEVRGEVPRQTFVNMGFRMQFVGGVNVYSRIQGDLRQVLPRLREQVRRVDANLVISDMRMLDDQLNMRLANERMLSFLSIGFALVATILAVVGLHGVLGFIVTRRTREIGIRIALGAEQANVIALVFREMLPVIIAGVLGGVVAALLGGRYVESQLFGVKAADLRVFASGVAAVLAASVGAALIPAWRASRMDPMRALRHE
jgi:predicted permease